MAAKRTASTQAAAVTDRDGFSLPGWVYHDSEFMQAEQEHVFAPAWQVVCHLNDIPKPGDYHTLEFLGEPILAVRQTDLSVKVFFNVCRHRAARLLDGQGHCASRIVCPYHAWSYGLDGRLLSLPQRQEFAHFSFDRYAIKPVQSEVYRGFVFARLKPGLPSVAEMLAPFDHELSAYHLQELQPLGRVTVRIRDVNWKNVTDNYSDSMHVAVAHPGLARLFGQSYGIDAQHWVDKMWGCLRDAPSSQWSERLYQALLPNVPQLPPERQRMWTYFKLWPNIAFDVYPEQVDFMQMIPLSPTRTLIREIAYAYPDERREMKAARYLNWRINRRVSVEDKDLIERVQAGMASCSYTPGPLGSNEVGLRSFARRLRELIPECRLERPPGAGWASAHRAGVYRV